MNTANTSADWVFDRILKDYNALAYTTTAEIATKSLLKKYPEYEWASVQIEKWFQAQGDIYDVMLTLLHEENVKNGNDRPVSFSG